MPLSEKVLRKIREEAIKNFPIKLEKPEWRSRDEFYDASEYDRDIYIDVATTWATRAEALAKGLRDIRERYWIDKDSAIIATETLLNYESE